MVKRGCGVIMLGLGGVLLLWLGYNLLIEQQAEFQLTLGGLGFTGALLFVGYKWFTEGQEQNHQHRRRKKKRKRSGSRSTRRPQ